MATSKYVEATQGGAVRLETQDNRYSGVCTTGLNTCICFVVRNQQKISLSHVDDNTDENSLLTEIEWVGDTIEMVIYYNNNSASAIQDLIQRCEGVASGITSTSIDYSSKYVACVVKADGSRDIEMEKMLLGNRHALNVQQKKKFVASSPKSEHAHAIFMLNSMLNCNKKALIVQFTDGKFNDSLPPLSDETQQLITEKDTKPAIERFKKKLKQEGTLYTEKDMLSFEVSLKEYLKQYLSFSS